MSGYLVEDLVLRFEGSDQRTDGIMFAAAGSDGACIVLR